MADVGRVPLRHRLGTPARAAARNFIEWGKRSAADGLRPGRHDQAISENRKEDVRAIALSAEARPWEHETGGAFAPVPSASKGKVLNARRERHPVRRSGTRGNPLGSLRHSAFASTIPLRSKPFGRSVMFRSRIFATLGALAVATFLSSVSYSQQPSPGPSPMGPSASAPSQASPAPKQTFKEKRAARQKQRAERRSARASSMAQRKTARATRAQDRAARKASGGKMNQPAPAKQ